MLFKDIPGHNHIKSRLIQTANNQRLSHAWLFFGQEGTGAMAMAIAFARYILCNTPGEIDACNNCSGCKKSEKYIHPDLHFVFPVNKTKSKDTDNPVSDDYLEEFRTFITKHPYGSLIQWYNFIDLENKQGIINVEESKRLISKLNLKSFESDHKVVIIWFPEKMHVQASNKLLKLIEEPPPLTVFMLISENPDKVLPTIRSRCTPLKIPRITEKDMYAAIIRNFNVNEADAHKIVRQAAGNYLKATELIINKNDTDSNFKKFRDLMRSCYKANIQELIRFSDSLSSLTREKQKAFLEYGLGIIRESMAYHFKEESIINLDETELDFIPSFSPFINGRNVIEISEEFNKAISDVEHNANSRIVFLDFALQLTVLIKR